jgi:hypothetical protein
MDGGVSMLGGGLGTEGAGTGQQGEDALGHILRAGSAYLVLSATPDPVFEYIANKIPAATRKLAIVRHPPERIQRRFNLSHSELYWLTQNAGDDHCIHPESIPEISAIVTAFVAKPQPGVVVLCGTEYLSTQNDFEGVLRLIQFLNDKVMVSRTCMLVVMDPESYPALQLHLVEDELETLPPAMFARPG